MSELEHHKVHRSGWLRAAVLGANDGIVSTASLIIGVASAGTAMAEILIVGLAGLVAGAMSMAAGEYVSVCSQVDIEKADLELEQKALLDNHEAELRELRDIYVGRGVSLELAEEVAKQLMEHDALGAHARDELGLSDMTRAEPIKAAFSSALSFLLGGALPLMAAYLSVPEYLRTLVAVCSLIFLAALGVLSAAAGGARYFPAALRICFWGGLAMTVTALVGQLFDVAI